MKLEPGKDHYPLPRIGQLITVRIEDGAGRWARSMSIVTAIAMEDRRRSARKRKSTISGKPTYATHLFEGGKDVLWLFPVPDAEGECSVWYYPPVQKI